MRPSEYKAITPSEPAAEEEYDSPDCVRPYAAAMLDPDKIPDMTGRPRPRRERQTERKGFQVSSSWFPVVSYSVIVWVHNIVRVIYYMLSLAYT